MLLEVISNYTREASNVVKIKMFKVKVGSEFHNYVSMVLSMLACVYVTSR